MSNTPSPRPRRSLSYDNPAENPIVIDDTGNPIINYTPESQATGAAPCIDAFKIRVPPFWKHNPRLWFIQLEAQFTMARISTDSTKYYQVLTVLDQDVLKIVEDIVEEPPASDKYETLKKNLIQRLSASESAKVSQLLNDVEIGDRSPSQFLRELRHLANGRVSDEFLKTLWLKRLPVQIQLILADNPGSLTQLANSADKIAEVVQVPQVFEAAIKPNIAQQITTLAEQVASLTLKLDQLNKTVSRSRSHQRPRSKSSARRSPDVDATNHPDWCWYHAKYQNKATKCIKPCAFTSSGDTRKPKN